MTQIRDPAVAGSFYPQEPIALQQQLDGFLSQKPRLETKPKALIVPHAGYIYSGSVAASAYTQLIPIREQIQRVVLLGPAHRVGFRGLAASSAEYFSTPLGLVRIDREALDEILLLPQVREFDHAHLEEHSLEVQLPFLQAVLKKDFGLIPLVVGESAAAEVAEVIERLWGGDETLFVISSDLSHYNAYEVARQQDKKTSDAILHHVIRVDAGAEVTVLGTAAADEVAFTAAPSGTTAGSWEKSASNWQTRRQSRCNTN